MGVKTNSTYLGMKVSNCGSFVWTRNWPILLYSLSSSEFTEQQSMRLLLAGLEMGR